jgi:AcrR family transcriptional regulator
MSESSSSTEQSILEAAKKVFIEKGKDGARMQEIADEAGINKALLHYYFRSKQKLFEAVFLESFEKFFPKINLLMSSDESFLAIIEVFIDNYIELILENPHIPLFVLHELNQNPGNLAQIMGGKIPHLPMLIDKINKEISDGSIKPIDPRQLMVNVIGLCIFPFVARPIIQSIFFENDETAYQQFLSDRKTEVYKFVLNSIKA